MVSTQAPGIFIAPVQPTSNNPVYSALLPLELLTHAGAWVHAQEPQLGDGPTVDENIRPAVAGMQALLQEYEEVSSWGHVPSKCPASLRAWLPGRPVCLHGMANSSCLVSNHMSLHTLRHNTAMRADEVCNVNNACSGPVAASDQSLAGESWGVVSNPNPNPWQIGGRMAEEGADVEALMKRMDALQTQIDAANGWELERQLERATEALRCPPGPQHGSTPEPTLNL